MKSIFEEIVEYGESKGGLTLEEFVDLSDALEGNSLWSIYGHGWQLQRLIKVIVDRGWDHSIVGEKIDDAPRWIGVRRKKEAEKWLREQGITVSTSIGRTSHPFVRSVRWETIGSNTPEVYRQAGFDLETMPTLLKLDADPDTGEILCSTRYHIASGAAFDKVSSDYKQVIKSFPQIRDLDPDFPSLTRSTPLAFDPARENFPDVSSSDVGLMIKVHPNGYYYTGGGRLSQEVINSLKGRAFVECKPYGLTPGGKPRKNLLDVCFHASTPKKSTKMLVWIHYGPEGVINSHSYRIDTRKGHWEIKHKRLGGNLVLYSATRSIDRGKDAGFYVLHDESGKLVERIGKPEPQEYW